MKAATGHPIFAALLLIIASTCSSQAPPHQEPSVGWSIAALKIDPSHYSGATVANGNIGITSTAVPFRFSDALFADSYERNPTKGTSTLIRTFGLLNLVVSVNGTPVPDTARHSQVLDMKHAYLQSTVATANTTFVTRARALRQFPNAALLDVTATVKQRTQVVFDTDLSASPMLGAVEFSHPDVSPQDIPGGIRIVSAKALSIHGPHTFASAQVFVFDPKLSQPPSIHATATGQGFSVDVTPDKPFHFGVIGTVTSSAQNSNPELAAQRIAAYAALQGLPDLIAKHDGAWTELWTSDIRIDGDAEAQQQVRLMLYNLYSFIRCDSRQSIAPMGLSSTSYDGHIFWDAETWMFPVLAILHPELARSMLDYRFDRLPQAQVRAQMYGFKGAMFPWESVASGEDDTVIQAITGTLEHHISADIGNAAWTYYEITKNKEWLKTEGYPLITNTANFWLSRVTRHGPAHFDVAGVVGADEQATDVTNDAFTNGAAIENLAAATAAAKELGIAPNPEWEEVRKNIPILHFPDGTTREHATYNGEQIKQADATLLAYPLSIDIDSTTARRDLTYYADRLNPDGPAMTKSISAILWARLGEADKATALYEEGLTANLRPPFGVLAESAYSNNPYFVTGAGGFLQTVLFGFAGLEVSKNGLQETQAHLPRSWTTLTITGIGSARRTVQFSNISVAK